MLPLSLRSRAPRARSTPAAILATAAGSTSPSAYARVAAFLQADGEVL